MIMAMLILLVLAYMWFKFLGDFFGCEEDKDESDN